jgi:hypothetical protein
MVMTLITAAVGDAPSFSRACKDDRCALPCRAGSRFDLAYVRCNPEEDRCLVQRFWGKSGTNGWSYDTMFVVTNLVIVTTGGGNRSLMNWLRALA